MVVTGAAVTLAGASVIAPSALIPALGDVCKWFVGIQPRAVDELSAKFPSENLP